MTDLALEKPTRRSGAVDHRLSSVVKSGFVLALSATTVVVLVVGAAGMEARPASADTFTAGTAEISTTPISTTASLSPRAPGDSTVEDFTVINDGAVPLRYQVTSTVTGSARLASQIEMTVWMEAAESDQGTACASGAPAIVLYGPGELGSPEGTLILGDSSGESGRRTLAPSTEQMLCFKFLLPLSTDNTYQGLRTTATFEVVAEQIAHE